jgi:hypothetical protein
MFIVTILIVGCTSKEEKALAATFKKELSYNKYLLKTEKAQLLDENNVTKVLITATYLYTANSDKNDTRDEEFIVGFQFEDENASFEDEDYSLTLDNNVSIKTILLDEGDERLKEISFISEWGEYYHLTFKHSKRTRFPLVFNSKTYGKKKLNFAKKAKFVYTKKGF